MTFEMKIDEWHTDLANVNLSDGYKLKLSSKKLESGKCQVKFYASVKGRRDLYGYVLVESNRTLREVVQGIRQRLTTLHRTKDFHHIHLYSIGKRHQDPLSFIVFDC